MATYATFGGLPIYKAPYIPIIKVKDWEIHIKPESVYVGGSGQQASDAERTSLFNKLQTWLWVHAVTWPKLKAASVALVSNADLAFILDLCTNPKKYYSDASRLYSHKTRDEAFLLETINYIILGYDPEKAQSLALVSIQNEKFISGESWLVSITNMPAQVKAQFKPSDAAGNDTYANGGTAPGTGTSAGSKKTFNWLIVGGILFMIARKK